MQGNLFLKLGVGAAALVIVFGGGYYAVKSSSIKALSLALDQGIARGDYLAAIAASNSLKDSGDSSPELAAKTSEATGLLVAEENFKKAKTAAERKDWADAGALLRATGVLSDPASKYYDEVRQLYDEVEALAAGVAHKTAVTVFTLEEKAKAEQTKRQELEQNKAKLENNLKDKDKTIAETEARAAETRSKLSEKEKEAQANQAALASEQAHSKTLLEAVASESKQKFFNEFRTYRDMAQKGREQLDSAVAELGGKRDVTALIYLSQGKILFEEAKSKISDLRNSRTPAAYQARVDDLLKSLEQFLDAAKQFRNAVVYLEDQGSAEFTGSLAKGKTALAGAVSYLAAVSDFIAANQ